MDKVKNSLLQPKEVCEFASKCGTNVCHNGCNPDRENTYSCALRRGLLMAEGYEIEWQTR